jgi:ribonuclease D
VSGSISYRYLIDPDQTREALAPFVAQQVVGLDTETYYDYGSREYRLSLLQLAAPSGEVLVIDALGAATDEARRLIEDAEIRMVAHNARFDENVLRGSGFAPAGFLDTLRLARRTLELPSFSLASVAAHLCQTTLDKSYQSSNWGRRPLLREQLDYAALDAQIVLRVYDELCARLSAEGRLDDELRRACLDAETEGRAVRSARHKPPPPLRPLTPEERRIFERLRDWRRQTAARERVAAYQICPDRTLEQLVILAPRSLEGLAEIYGLGASRISKYGAELLAHLDLARSPD